MLTSESAFQLLANAFYETKFIVFLQQGFPSGGHSEVMQRGCSPTLLLTQVPRPREDHLASPESPPQQRAPAPR